MVKVYAARLLCLHLVTGEVLDSRAGARPLYAIIGDAQVTLAAHAHNNGRPRLAGHAQPFIVVHPGHMIVHRGCHRKIARDPAAACLLSRLLGRYL